MAADVPPEFTLLLNQMASGDPAATQTLLNWLYGELAASRTTRSRAKSRTRRYRLRRSSTKPICGCLAGQRPWNGPIGGNSSRRLPK